MGTMASDRGSCSRAPTWSRAAAFLTPCRLPPHPSVVGLCRVPPRIWLARVLWRRAMPTRPSSGAQEALRPARQGEHLPSLAYAECFCGPRLPVPETWRQPCACRRLDGPGRGAQLAAPRRAGAHLRGWALAMQGEAAAGVAHLRQGLASPDVGPTLLRSHWLALLAEAYGRAGQPQAGLQVLAEA